MWIKAAAGVHHPIADMDGVPQQTVGVPGDEVDVAVDDRAGPRLWQVRSGVAIGRVLRAAGGVLAAVRRIRASDEHARDDRQGRRQYHIRGLSCVHRYHPFHAGLIEKGRVGVLASGRFGGRFPAGYRSRTSRYAVRSNARRAREPNPSKSTSLAIPGALSAVSSESPRFTPTTRAELSMVARRSSSATTASTAPCACGRHRGSSRSEAIAGRLLKRRPQNTIRVLDDAWDRHVSSVYHPDPGQEETTTSDREVRVSRLIGRILLGTGPCETDPEQPSISARRCRRARATYPQTPAGRRLAVRRRQCLRRHSAEAGRPLGLAPGGVYPAASVARGAGGLLHHRFTLTRTPAIAGWGRWRSVSVALSRESPRVGVTHHRALRSPDLPRLRGEPHNRGRPVGSPAFEGYGYADSGAKPLARDVRTAIQL